MIQVKRKNRATDYLPEDLKMFDFDGNGVVDPGEEYLSFRVWEEMNGIDEDEAIDEILDILEEEDEDEAELDAWDEEDGM